MTSNKPGYPQVLYSGDFKLERVKPEFKRAYEIFEIVDGQRAWLGEWLEWVDYTQCVEDVYPHFWNKCKADARGYYITVDGKIVGSVDFVDMSMRHKTAEIGYWLSRDMNGRGIMTRAVRELEKFAFDVLGINRVVIGADVGNIPSQRVAERCGYVREGVARGDFVLRGESRDTVKYSKLKSEWEKENKNA